MYGRTMHPMRCVLSLTMGQARVSGVRLRYRIKCSASATLRRVAHARPFTLFAHCLPVITMAAAAGQPTRQTPSTVLLKRHRGGRSLPLVSLGPARWLNASHAIAVTSSLFTLMAPAGELSAEIAPARWPVYIAPAPSFRQTAIARSPPSFSSTTSCNLLWYNALR